MHPLIYIIMPYNCPFIFVEIKLLVFVYIIACIQWTSIWEYTFGLCYTLYLSPRCNYKDYGGEYRDHDEGEFEGECSKLQ